MNRVGEAGEQAAAGYLKALGYEIVCRNFRSRFGEIDVIAKNGGFLVFAEVKTRKRGALVGGAESVDERKIRRITRTAEYYLSGHSHDLQPRFDVIEMERTGESFRVANHIENAF